MHCAGAVYFASRLQHYCEYDDNYNRSILDYYHVIGCILDYYYFKLKCLIFFIKS